MKNNIYKIGFFVLLFVTIVETVYFFSSTRSFTTGGLTGEKNTTDSTMTSTTANPQEEEYRRLVDSVKMVKDSINSVVSFMNDSIDLRELTLDQRHSHAETFSTLARIKLHLDFRLDNVRLELLKTESEKLTAVIKKFDKQRERLNKLSNKLKSLTVFVNTTIEVLAFAASQKGIIVAPPHT